MSSFRSILDNTNDLVEIDHIIMSIMSPEEIKRGSVCEITSVNTFDGSDPVIGGLFDPRMGQLERGNICSTCKAGYDICPGHFGHIELAMPVFYVHFIDVVKKLLGCICIRCSKILIDKTDIKKIQKIRGMSASK